MSTIVMLPNRLVVSTHRVVISESTRHAGKFDVRCGCCGPLAYGARHGDAVRMSNDHEDAWKTAAA